MEIEEVKGENTDMEIDNSFVNNRSYPQVNGC